MFDDDNISQNYSSFVFLLGKTDQTLARKEDIIYKK